MCILEGEVTQSDKPIKKILKNNFFLKKKKFFYIKFYKYWDKDLMFKSEK